MIHEAEKTQIRRNELYGMLGHFVTLPMPQWMFGLFVDKDTENFLAVHTVVYVFCMKNKRAFCISNNEGMK